MTELCHGSNVSGIETKAIYHQETDEFELLTPGDTAQKFWIGNALLHANYAVVFAQLYCHQENQGVHAFLVPLRNDKQQICSGIKIVDVGHKVGLNGIDNARIWFDHVRVPRKNLLNRFADIDPKTKEYKRTVASKGDLFRVQIGALLLGRVMTAVSSVSAMKLSLTIALRYALSRRQFSMENPRNKEELHITETPIINYMTHQVRRWYNFTI